MLTLRTWPAFLFCLAILMFLGPAEGWGKRQAEKRYAFRVVKSYPHDPQAFTQGLFFHAGYLYEGTGLYGNSSLRRVDLATGRVERIHYLARDYFGEGISLCRGQIYQLTWQSRVGFIYELHSFRQIGSFNYDTEGWGLTCDGRLLIMSDGSNILRFIEPIGMKVVKTLAVTAQSGPVFGLNELEYIKGMIYANVWNTELIALISPRNGFVQGWLDLTGLRADLGEASRPDVLNGIAYDEEKDRLFVTGKFWPKLYQIELVPRSGNK